METFRYLSRGGLSIQRSMVPLDCEKAIEPLTDRLNEELGAVFSSGYEYPGRYTRWDLGFVNPPLRLVARQRSFALEALNLRGEVLLEGLAPALNHPAIELQECGNAALRGRVPATSSSFAEEERSQQPSIFTVIRCLLAALGSEEDHFLGFYGAFGYDLAFQFEPIRQRLERPPEQRDLVLYLPDELTVVDHRKEVAHRVSYEFHAENKRTEGLPRTGPKRAPDPARSPERREDHAPGEFGARVLTAREAFRRGDLFEVVPGQSFFEPCQLPPSVLFARLQATNPSPYGALINLGEGEYLVSASPEMFVRVEGDRVESCPIAGTISRGADALGDAAQIRELLDSVKEESELTMCTDVDRNDKSRICRPGTVRVLGRRQLEIYSRLIHTVDHVEGRLRPGLDALDAFLAHSWAVTVTGAPKIGAMQFIEDQENSPRAWYGGAIGYVRADGSLNTGITLRTMRIRQGIAEVRAGATLLFESDPEQEDRECRLKASALLAILQHQQAPVTQGSKEVSSVGQGKRVVLVDHQDSFVHTLGGYLRETGAEIITLRAGFPLEQLDRLKPDLAILSPGPGRPQDFDLSGTLRALCQRGIPSFGVCLGLQGLVEYCGGELGVLSQPMHGKRSRVQVLGGRLFRGLPRELWVGRYHSLFALRQGFPQDLEITAQTEEGTVMAVEHRTLPMAAVQFHPESIMTLDGRVGHRLLENVMADLCHRS